MITEAEAKTKWCPFARVATNATTDHYGSTAPAGPVANRWTAGPHPHSGQPKKALCIAADCMAWRVPAHWFDETGAGRRNDDGSRGFCGLAGQP